MNLRFVSLFYLWVGCSLSTSLQAERLQTVVVFGERGERLLSQSSSLVEQVEEEQIMRPGLEHPSQILQQTAGAWVSRNDGQEHLTAIRSPVFTGAGACGAFWLAEDGIPLRANGFCNVNQLFDSHFEAANSVEVYKGPHSSLYGGNAQFGGINVQLPTPGEVRNELSGQASVHGYRRLHTRYAVQGDQHGGAVLATFIHNDSWREDSGYNQQKISAKHAWQSGWLSVENGISLMRLRQDTAGYVSGEDAYKDRAASRENQNPEAFRHADAARAYSRWRWRNLDQEWSFTPYARSNQMTFLMHFVPWQPEEQNNHDSLGWHLQWRRHLAGGTEIFWGQEYEYTWAGLTEDQPEPFPNPNSPNPIFPQGVHYDYRVQAQNLATNAGIYWQATPGLALDAAVRLDSVRYDYRTLQESGSACGPDVTGCRFFRPENQANRFNNHSAHLGFVYQLLQPVYWFGKAATGYRVPQASELYRAQNPGEIQVRAENLISVETGLRGQAGDLFWQGAVYAMENRRGIIQDPERRYVNGVQSTHRGFEYLLDYRLGNDWQLNAGGTIADHRYANNPQMLLLDEEVALRNNTMDSAPRNTHHIGVRWQPSPLWSLRSQWLYMGSYYLDPENEYRYPGHQLVHLNANWQVLPTFEVSLGINNALGQAYAERADINMGTPRYFPGNTRSATLGLRYVMF